MLLLLFLASSVAAQDYCHFRQVGFCVFIFVKFFLLLYAHNTGFRLKGRGVGVG
jgi:hypothetical protein